MSRSTEGWIQKRIRPLKGGKQSTKYIGRIKPPGMEEIYSTPYDKKGTSKEYGTAAYWLAEQRKLLREGRIVDPRARGWTVAEWAQNFYDKRAMSDNTARGYRSMITQDLEPSDFGHMPIATVQDTDIADWMNAMMNDRYWTERPNLAASTVNVRRAMISAIFTDAALKKLRMDNPIKTVKKVRDNPGVIPLDPQDIPTKDQLWKWYDLAAEVSPHLQEAILIAAGTGMRPGELFGMGESQLTRNRSGQVTEIYVSHQLRLGIPGIQFGRLKTDNSYRRLPVGSNVAKAIDRHLARYPLDPEAPHGAVILRGPTARPWARTTFDEHWDAIRTEAKTPAAIWYKLRHYYVSGLIEGGASPRVVMERAGHASAAYTLGRYSRLWPNADAMTALLSDVALERDIDGTPSES